MKAEAGERAISLSFDPPRGVSPRAAYLYADQPLVVEHAVPQGFERSGNGYRLTVTPALNAIRNPGRLAGVLLLEGAGFIRRPTAVQIDVPVATGNPAPAPVPPADRAPPVSAVAAGLAAAAIVTGALLVRRRPKSRQT